MDGQLDRRRVASALARAGCVAADDEAAELIDAAGDGDELRALVERRAAGEPLAWIIGRTVFCGIDVAVDPGVYVPRWQSESLARVAAHRLPASGAGVDLATGSGALAVVMQAVCPRATVVATELDPAAAGCARRNGVTVYEGDLLAPLPRTLRSRVDVVCGVLPYVPRPALRLLPRDVQAYEPRRALDGGENGLSAVADAIMDCRALLRPGGWLVLEVGIDQIAGVSDLFRGAGYRAVGAVEDGEGDQRAVAGRWAG